MADYYYPCRNLPAYVAVIVDGQRPDLTVHVVTYIAAQPHSCLA